MARRHMALGDPVPVVPITHFTKERFSFADAWELVGPTIQRNYRKCSPQDLYCIAFIEGMRMAIHAMNDETPSGE